MLLQLVQQNAGPLPTPQYASNFSKLSLAFLPPSARDGDRYSEPDGGASGGGGSSFGSLGREPLLGSGAEPQPGSGAGAPAGCGAEPREEIFSRFDLVRAISARELSLQFREKLILERLLTWDTWGLAPSLPPLLLSSHALHPRRLARHGHVFRSQAMSAQPLALPGCEPRAAHRRQLRL